MFKKTRLQLTLITSAIVFALFVLTSTILYFFMQEQLYSQFDASVLGAIRPVMRIMQMNNNPANPPIFPQNDPNRNNPFHMPTTFLLFDAKGHLLYKPAFFTPAEIATLRAAWDRTTATTVSLSGQFFRVQTVTLTTAPMMGNPETFTIEAVRNVDQVVQSLQELLHLLVILTVLSAVGSILIGFVLASRALVPIERSWERQRQFVADASHELRTPIMAVQARTELLLHHPEQSIEEASPRILAMYKELRRASRLLEDLLTLSRVDSNSQQIVKQEVDVAAVLREVADMVQPLCEQKGLQLLLHAPDSLVHAVDEARFSQMLFIFVDNAMKYNREGGKIIITLAQHKRLELMIEDTGIGIEESEIPRIFDRFYRADKARSHEGTGLGLAIAKFIIDAHEATVRVKSAVGIGTNITISFP